MKKRKNMRRVIPSPHFMTMPLTQASMNFLSSSRSHICCINSCLRKLMTSVVGGAL